MCVCVCVCVCGRGGGGGGVGELEGLHLGKEGEGWLPPQLNCNGPVSTFQHYELTLQLVLESIAHRCVKMYSVLYV